MEVRSIPGQDGMPTQEFGLVDLTCRSGLALELAGSEALAGAGDIGDSIGTADTRFMAVAGISPVVPRFTTAAISTERDEQGLTEGVAESTEDAMEPTEDAAEPTRDALEPNPAEIWPHGVMSTTVRGRFPDLSTETSRRLADMQNPTARAACAPPPSVALIMEARPEASRRADSPASVAEADSTAVGAGATAAAAGDVSPHFPAVGEFRIGDSRYATNEVELRTISVGGPLRVGHHCYLFYGMSGNGRRCPATRAEDISISGRGQQRVVHRYSE